MIIHENNTENDISRLIMCTYKGNSHYLLNKQSSNLISNIKKSGKQKKNIKIDVAHQYACWKAQATF